MPTPFVLERAADLDQLLALRGLPARGPFLPQHVEHIYVKLDLEHRFENAATADDARGFLRSVWRASLAAEHVAVAYGGRVLEIQGSLIHVGLPQPFNPADGRPAALAFAAALHHVYQSLFPAQSRVNGWRMTIDGGRTLVVAGRGIHNDASLVSLGRAANRPAKHLYHQLELPESARSLKRHYVADRDDRTGRWRHQNLDSLPFVLTERDATDAARQVREAEPKLDFSAGTSRTLAGGMKVEARALPVPAPGTPGSPTPERPHTLCGWVMRVDLDGFTGRVEDCFDHDTQLRELAGQFYAIMDDAAAFAGRHGETLAQLPWAGDNFTAAAVFPNKPAYEAAVPRRLVELSLDYAKEMDAPALDAGFGGWAHGVAGGTLHGNTVGNVYLAGIEFEGRRFLVGAGEGFGRSAQAFGDVDPDPGYMALYHEDHARLDERYKSRFEAAVTVRGEQSSLYKIANIQSLTANRAAIAAAAAAAVNITFNSVRPEPVPARPYAR